MEPALGVPRPLQGRVECHAPAASGVPRPLRAGRAVSPAGPLRNFPQGPRASRRSGPLMAYTLPMNRALILTILAAVTAGRRRATHLIRRFSSSMEPERSTTPVGGCRHHRPTTKTGLVG